MFCSFSYVLCTRTSYLVHSTHRTCVYNEIHNFDTRPPPTVLYHPRTVYRSSHSTSRIYKTKKTRFRNKAPSMCIIFTPKFKPKETLLVVSQLETEVTDGNCYQLTYINSIDAPPPDAKRQRQAWGGASAQMQRNAAPLMVVPVPNQHGMREGDFTLFAVDSRRARALRHGIEELNKEYTPPPPRGFGRSKARSRSKTPGNKLNKLQVQQVGAYRIAVAPTLNDLVTRAPWSHFNIAASHVQAILADMSVQYPSGYGFVIAEGDPSKPRLDQAGFSVLYRDDEINGAFFPTAHEVQPVQSNGMQLCEMDVTCVGLGIIVHPGSCLDQAPLTPEGLPPMRLDPRAKLPGHSSQYEAKPVRSPVLRCDDSAFPALTSLDSRSQRPRWSWVAEIFRALPRRGAEGTAHANTVVQHKIPRIVTTWALTGIYQNKNVRGRPATDNDVATTSRLLSDLNVWVERSLTSAGNGQTAASKWQNHQCPRNGHAMGAKVDLALALLARQLAQPGTPDRVSDGPSGAHCTGVAYLNLDLTNCDLNEADYAKKDTTARLLTNPNGGNIDTTGSSYVRLSATLGPWKSLDSRTVGAPTVGAGAVPTPTPGSAIEPFFYPVVHNQGAEGSSRMPQFTSGRGFNVR